MVSSRAALLRWFLTKQYLAELFIINPQSETPSSMRTKHIQEIEPAYTGTISSSILYHDQGCIQCARLL